jgi:hypothetical protein
MLKVWWVLAWYDYYPEAGLENVKKTFYTEAEAREYAEFLQSEGAEWDYDNVEVVNISDYLE